MVKALKVELDLPIVVHRHSTTCGCGGGLRVSVKFTVSIDGMLEEVIFELQNEFVAVAAGQAVLVEIG